MKHRLLSICIGLFWTLVISAGSYFYLHYSHNKQWLSEKKQLWESFEKLDNRWNDVKYSWSTPPLKDHSVVLLAIDDAALKEIGRWPWSRETMNTILEKLMDLGASSVGLDVIFSEPERDRPEQDALLAKTIEKHSGKIVLGTYSDHELHIKPYQDYCVNEAFLREGGEELVKINPTFVVDDTGAKYDELPWSQVFKPLFDAIEQNTETQYLQQLNKKEIAELTGFQKNYLKSQKSWQNFQYCDRWLTDQDELWVQHQEQLKPLYAHVFSSKEETASQDLETNLRLFKSQVHPLPIPQYGEWQSNIPEVQRSAAYTGSFVTALDNDGYIRRYPLFYRSGNRLGTSFIPSLAMQTYLAHTGWRADVKIEETQNKKMISSFRILDPSQEPEALIQEIPVDSQGRLMINFYGPSNTIASISATELFTDDDEMNLVTFHSEGAQGKKYLSQRVKKDDFLKGKSVIIGATAMAIYDLRNTPTAVNYPGPELHATVLSNLLHGQFLKKAQQEHWVLPLSLVVLGISLSVLLSFFGAGSSMLVMFVSLAILSGIDFLIFKHFQTLFSSIFLFLEVPCIAISMVFFKYGSEERKKNELRKMFSKYVAPAVVDELLKNADNLKLGGRKQEMSVFFSDVRGFTEFSEKMDPQALSEFLNEYLTPMTEIVFNNKGTLDKYMGDGLMAFFGAPVAYPEHAYYACKCAIESIEKLKELQKECEKRNWPKIDIGIGINTGSMSVGNMGSKIVQSYTVIGDAVNLGSRLEAATKEYGARILISETTYEQVKDHFVLREVDRVRVKGKKEPVRAYELIDQKINTNNYSWMPLYKEAYQAYLDQDFLKSKLLFSELILQRPEDQLAKLYKKRCEEFIDTPPLKDWDGVYQMKTK